MSPRHAITIALATVALGAAAPADQQAEAKDNAPAPAETKCPEFGGGKPGDQKTLSETKTVNGKVVIVRSYTVICGDDGKWHELAAIRPGGLGHVVDVVKVRTVLVAARR
jgi:hypothetical protein